MGRILPFVIFVAAAAIIVLFNSFFIVRVDEQAPAEEDTAVEDTRNEDAPAEDTPAE